MTDITLESIKALLEKVTPGKWEVDALGYIRGDNNESILDRVDNVPFIAQAPAIVEWLLVRVEELKKCTHVAQYTANQHV